MNHAPDVFSIVGRQRKREPAGKRKFDIVAAGSGLILLAPLLLIAALAIKLTSRGPVFFMQPRRGRDGRVFRICKFRTLDHDRCDAPEQRDIQAVSDHDSRVFPVGLFLRTRGIDEIPQLWNVLRGEMSIVGPRPHAIPHDDFYLAHVSGYAHRYAVKPGITGWAQVNGSRGRIRDLEEARQRVQFDRRYIDNASLLLDIEIVLRTVRILLLGTDVKQQREAEAQRTVEARRAEQPPAAAASAVLAYSVAEGDNERMRLRIERILAGRPS